MLTFAAPVQCANFVAVSPLSKTQLTPLLQVLTPMLERLDKLMVDKGLAASRTQAQRLISAGAVEAQLEGQWLALNKPSMKLSRDTVLQARAIDELRYVSRAGLKLELAVKHLECAGLWSRPTPILGANVLDIGQSTGGFTDCLLQSGARAVIGVDVGHGQLASKLRGDPRVTCLEGINARELPVSLIADYAPGGFDLAVMDVSFISQRLVIPSLASRIRSGGWLLSLVKPQFEVGKEGLGKGGIVKSSDLFEQVERDISACARENHLSVHRFFESGIQGSDGNREFFMLAQQPQCCPSTPK